MKTKIIMILYSASLGALFSELIEMVLNEKWQFIAILLVVMFDALLGIIRALINGDFQTKKAFKGVFMLVAFWGLLAVVLSIEKGFDFASFLSEAILLPILIFQVISIVKNMHLLGLIEGDLLKRILSNIDKHKTKEDSL